MFYSLQICTVCGYDSPCLVNNEDIVECEDAKFRRLVNTGSSWKINKDLDLFLLDLVERQQVIDEEDEAEAQRLANMDDGMTVPDEPYDKAMDMQMEREDNDRLL